MITGRSMDSGSPGEIIALAVSIYVISICLAAFNVVVVCSGDS
jgi:hypothetical protein